MFNRNTFESKKILVTGGAGFVGVNMAKKLLDLGVFVRATIHRKEPIILDERIEYMRCDLTKKEDCQKAVHGMEYVIMCAANTSGAGVMATTPLVHVTPNVIMNSLMLEAAHEAGVKKFLYISSNAVYPVTDHPVKEDEMKYGDLFEKYYFAGWMKQFSEVLCSMYAKIKSPMKTIVVRPANIYGPHDDFEWETSHVIPALIRKVVERHDPIEVWGDGNDLKEFIFVEDFVEGLLSALEKMETYDPVNIAVGKPATVRQALDIILAADGYQDANIVFNTSKPTMIPRRLIDTTKAKNLLGFEAKTSFKEGLAKTIVWYRNYRSQKI